MAAVPGLICAALVWMFVREPARDAVVAVAAAEPGAPAAPERPTSAAATLVQAMGYRNMWICILLSIVMVPWMILAGPSCPPSTAACGTLSHRETSYLVGALGISAAVFAFIVPGLSDRLGASPS